jgi:serine protease Do
MEKPESHRGRVQGARDLTGDDSSELSETMLLRNGMRRRTAALRLLGIFTLALISCRPGGDTEVSAAVPEERRAEIPPTVSVERRTPIVVAVHSVLPAVVNIETEASIRQREIDPFSDFFFAPRRQARRQSLGSGVIWGDDGVIVTNAHVIEGASRIVVNTYDGRQLPARVIGTDPDSDLAVLQVDEKNLPVAAIGSSTDLLIGETVIAVGNPFGLSGSVTTGVVSAIGRSVPGRDGERIYTDFIQTDASINPGNSGGPLLNIEGRVIGINVAVHAGAQGIGFAIPVDRARKIVDDLRRYGRVHVAWTGAVTATLTPEEARRIDAGAARGALVTRIFSGSPADRAGLRPGDIVINAGGQPIDSREALNTLLATAVAGRALPLVVTRGERQLTIPVTPGEAPRDLGLEILRDVAGISVTAAGGALLVEGVRRGSRADRIGLQPGDRIVGVNGIEVRSVEELNEELRRSSERASFVLSVARGRLVYTLTFPMGDGDRTGSL